MSSVRWTQLSLIGGALLLIVLLMLGSTVPNSSDFQAEKALNTRIDEAIALVQGQNPMQGIQALRQIAEEAPDNIRVQWQLAEFSVMSGQLDKAAERYQKVIELDKEQEWLHAWTRLAEVQSRGGDNASAIQSLETFIGLTTDEEAKTAAQNMITELKK